MNLKAIIIGTALAATAGYSFTPSDNLTRHCKEPVLFEKENLCFISQYSSTIKQEAQEYNLPPELIAAILYQENNHRIKAQDWADYTSSRINRFHSAGPGQIYTTTAARLDNVPSITASDVETYYYQLNKPEQAIRYVAQELAYLQHTTNSDLTTLAGIDLLASEYRTGHRPTPQINNHGYDVLIILRRPNVYNALGIEFAKSQRQHIQNYLNSTQKERVE